MYGDAYWQGGPTLSRDARPGSPNPMILRRQKEFHRAANSANVSVYTVDPTPKVELILGGADARAGPVSPDDVATEPLESSNLLGAELDAWRNSLRLAANLGVRINEAAVHQERR